MSLDLQGPNKNQMWQSQLTKLVIDDQHSSKQADSAIPVMCVIFHIVWNQACKVWVWSERLQASNGLFLFQYWLP